MEWIAAWFLIITFNPSTPNAYSYSIPVSSQKVCVTAAKNRKNENKDVAESSPRISYTCEVGNMPAYKSSNQDKLKWQKTWFLAVVQNERSPNATSYTIPYKNKKQCLDSGNSRKAQNPRNRYICEIGEIGYFSK